MIDTDCVPSSRVLSGAVSVKVAEVDPAGMLAVAGTVRRDVLSDESETVSAEVERARDEYSAGAGAAFKN